MLTKREKDGTLIVSGVEVGDNYPEMYGAFLKLHDYEETGFEPDDLTDFNECYEKKHLYKIFYGTETIYCETKENAETMVELLKKAGYDAHMNVWSWHALIEI